MNTEKSLAENVRDFIFDKEPFGAASIKQAHIETVTDAEVRAIFGKASKPYTEISFKLTGHATTPVLSILDNETDATFTASRLSEGVYRISASSAIFTANKTQVILTPIGADVAILTAELETTARVAVHGFTHAGAVNEAIVAHGVIRIYE